MTAKAAPTNHFPIEMRRINKPTPFNRISDHGLNETDSIISANIYCANENKARPTGGMACRFKSAMLESRLTQQRLAQDTGCLSCDGEYQAVTFCDTRKDHNTT